MQAPEKGERIAEVILYASDGFYYEGFFRLESLLSALTEEISSLILSEVVEGTVWI